MRIRNIMTGEKHFGNALRKCFAACLAAALAISLPGTATVALADDDASKGSNSTATVTLAPADGAKWSGNGGKASFTIKPTGWKSVYVKPTDKTRYYISGVTANPAGNASVKYSATTGEVFVENVTGDVTLTPQVEEKAIPSSLAVTGVEFNRDGIYDESNAAVQVTFSVKVEDQFGNPVPDVTVYSKDDESEVSYTQARKSSAEGIATFKHVYGVERYEGTADYNAVFSLSSKFAEGDAVAEQDIHLVLNRKRDLVLYTDQIVGTVPGTHDGKVIGVPDGYEIWTGEVHQGALVVGSGTWVGPTDGAFTGLSVGQHLIRFGERVDASTNTFYFASDPADFFVPRGVQAVNDDEAADTEEEPAAAKGQEPAGNQENAEGTIAPTTKPAKTPTEPTTGTKPNKAASNTVPATNAKKATQPTAQKTEGANSASSSANATEGLPSNQSGIVPASKTTSTTIADNKTPAAAAPSAESPNNEPSGNGDNGGIPLWPLIPIVLVVLSGAIAYAVKQAKSTKA